MNTDNVMLLFDFIIILFGIYGMLSSIHMKRTGRPWAVLLSEEERSKIRDSDSLCRRLYLPTMLFAAASCIYGTAAVVNWYFIHQKAIIYAGAVCYLFVCVWYIRELQKIKADHIA